MQTRSPIKTLGEVAKANVPLCQKCSKVVDNLNDKDQMFVNIPNWVFTHLKKPKEIRWFRRGGLIYIGNVEPPTDKEFNFELKRSIFVEEILNCLIGRPKTFTELAHELGNHSKCTITKYLKECANQGFVSHGKRITPYIITEKGREYLDLIKPKTVQDFVIESVKGGKYGGSLIFRVPKRFVQAFNQLYHPRTLESLRRILLVGFEFWVNKYSQAAYVRTIAHGKDFNNDDIWDLTVYETPAGGYPNIKNAVKKTEKQGYFTVLEGKKIGLSSLSLMRWALDALEEKLARMGN